MFNEVSYSYGEGLGDWLPTTIGAGGTIGGGIFTALGIGGKFAGPIGMGISAISSLIAGIFAAHSAKVKREDEISGAWAASGPQAIEAVMSSYRSGQISGPEARQALDQIEGQFRSMAQPITKYDGKFGAYPDPNGPRPPDGCNWACGTSWALHQQLLGYKAQLSAGGAGGLNLGALGGDPVMLIGLGVIAWLLLK
mgnify:CR=1 FL=1